MSTTTAAKPATIITVGPVRFSYLRIWEPAAVDEGQEKKYSASLIISKDDKKSIEAINKAIEAAKQQGKESKFKGKIPAKLKTPLRDGDEERLYDEAYENAYFINANAKTKPGIVDKDRNPIMNQDDFYSGCFGYANISFYPFNTSGNVGIACGLNHVMKTKDGEPLSSRVSVDTAFADLVLSDDDDIF